MFSVKHFQHGEVSCQILQHFLYKVFENLDDGTMWQYLQLGKIHNIRGMYIVKIKDLVSKNATKSSA